MADVICHAIVVVLADLDREPTHHWHKTSTRHDCLSGMPFKRPSAAATAAALGPVDATSVPDAAARRALDARLDPDAFSRVPRVRRGDWLSEHEERGQSLKSYQRRSYRTEPHAYFTTCYMVPYGKFPPGCSPDLSALADIAAAFFGFPVVCTKPVRLREVSHGSRVGASGQTQLLLSDVYDHLRRVKLPRDAFARVAVTMTDLYPGEEWNFVYGQAVMTDGIGAYSFARFGPDEVFMGEGAAPAHTELSAADKTLLLRRSAKVLLHETTHVLGMRVRYLSGWLAPC